MSGDELTQRLLNNESPLKIHLIGVSGSGMSGLALLLLGMGHQVSGSDRVSTIETERMEKLGLSFNCPHTAENAEDKDLIVYSSAIRPTNPCLSRARELDVPCILRAQCLAAILHTKSGVIISGTHGKTTTSAMASYLLRESGKAPSHYVGAEIPILGSNAHWDAQGELMVAEGDESDGTLELYRPAWSIILNIEEEHLDFYEGIDHLKKVFLSLVNKTSIGVIYCKEDDVATEIATQHQNAISYGWEDADYTASDLKENPGSTDFSVHKNGQLLGRVQLGIPGRHNVLNALSAIALADQQGSTFQSMGNALSQFAGAKRRFETKYLSQRFRVVDDYGHHPTEIDAVIQTARQLNPERIVIAFQPHRYSRTQLLKAEFGKALAKADLVYVSDVYAASEEPIEGISGQTIVDEVLKHGKKAIFTPLLDSAHLSIGNALKKGDLLMTLGAGNIHEVGTRIISDLSILDNLLDASALPSKSAKLYEPMKKHTTMLVGGAAQYWIEPSSFSSLQNIMQFCNQRSVPTMMIGRGSNLLVRDGGIKGCVIHPKGDEFSSIQVQGSHLRVGAGVRLKKVANTAYEFGIGGFEWMEGIPGNIGGSMRMNAGAMGTEMFDQVVECTVLNENNEIVTYKKEDIEFFYRNVPKFRTEYVLSVLLEGQLADKKEIHALLESSKLKRKQSQPISANSGCTFKNPKEIPAGQLIDELGLKGLKSGNAEISTVHGNFFTNKGKASSASLLDLIRQAQSKALSERNIQLETEVQIIGEEVSEF